MRSLLLTIAAAFVLSIAPAASGLDLGQVHRDAAWVAHLDLELLKSTEMGRRLLAQLATEEADNKLAAFKAIFGFDPREDLREVVAYGWGRTEDDGVILVRGRFDADRLVTLIKANDDYSAVRAPDAVIHSWIDDKEKAKALAQGVEPKRSFGVIVSDDTIVISNIRDNAIDAHGVLTGREPGLDDASVLSAVEGPDGESFLMAAANLRAIADLDPKAAMFRNSSYASFALGERSGQCKMALSVHTQNEETAQAMQQVAQGLLALASLQQEKDPRAARIASMARVERSANAVSLVMTCSPETALELMDDGKQGEE